MDEDTKLKLSKLFPVGVVEAASVYLPAVSRLGLKEMSDLTEYLQHKLEADARKLIRSKMTRQELAEETKQIAVLMNAIAEEQNEAIQLGKSIMLAIFKAALIAAVGL